MESSCEQQRWAIFTPNKQLDNFSARWRGTSSNRPQKEHGHRPSCRNPHQTRRQSLELHRHIRSSNFVALEGGRVARLELAFGGRRWGVAACFYEQCWASGDGGVRRTRPAQHRAKGMCPALKWNRNIYGWKCKVSVRIACFVSISENEQYM